MALFFGTFGNKLAGGMVACATMFATWHTAASARDLTPIPVPKNVIYAGQIISGKLLRDRNVPVKYLNRVSVYTRHSDVVGKVAKITLVPSRPIPTNYLTEPDVVRVNQRAMMLYRVGGLRITAEVSPLNNAQAGDQVRARNLQTGIIVYGVAQEDGTIRAGVMQ